MKKILALVLAVVLAAGLCSGCAVKKAADRVVKSIAGGQNAPAAEQANPPADTADAPKEPFEIRVELKTKDFDVSVDFKSGEQGTEITAK